jgi:predicted alpha/beta-fold hydrolase
MNRRDKINFKIPFTPDRTLKNGHAQTIYASLFHKPRNIYKSEKIRVRIDENTLIKCLYTKIPQSKKCVILIHGLEGSANSNYVLSTSNKLLAKGISVVRMNIRNCGDTLHLTDTLYNAGLTSDVFKLIKYCNQDLGYKEIFIAGFSLGANIVLKLAGEAGKNIPEGLVGVCAVSPPLDLSLSAKAIIKTENKVYDRYYLTRLVNTYTLKNKYYPDKFDLDVLKKVKNLKDFDDYITGPSFDYKDAEDYYQNNSSLKFLPNINIPTLIIQAKDDPIIPFSCTEAALKIDNNNISYLITDHGGHVGFINGKKETSNDYDKYWAENRLIDFFS